MLGSGERVGNSVGNDGLGQWVGGLADPGPEAPNDDQKGNQDPGTETSK